MVRLILLLLPSILFGQFSYQVGDERKVISSWTNQDITVSEGEILTIDRIQENGGVKFFRSDSTVVWASAVQVLSKTEPHDSGFMFSDSDIGRSIIILADIDTQNLLAGRMYQIINIGTARLACQLENGAWLGVNGLDVNWRFTKESEVFEFAPSMVGALISGIGYPFVGGQYYIISEILSPTQARTLDGNLVSNLGFMVSWRVHAWFPTSSLPDKVKITNEYNMPDLPEEWTIIDHGDGIRLPTYKNDTVSGLVGLFYLEQDSVSGTTYTWNFGGGVETMRSTWHFMLTPNYTTSYPPDHPYHGAGILFSQVVPSASYRDPRGQYGTSAYMPAVGGGWVYDSFGAGFDVESPDADTPPPNPITEDYLGNKYKGWLVKKHYVAEIPDIFPLEQDPIWTMKNLAQYYQNQYNYMRTNWGEDWLYENMGGGWTTATANTVREPDPHILNVEVTYNIKSFGAQDYYMVSPVQMRVTGGVMNSKKVQSGTNLLELSGFSLKFVDHHSSTVMSLNNRRMVNHTYGGADDIDIMQTQYLDKNGRLITTREPLDKPILFTGFNENGKKLYEGEWGSWICVTTRYNAWSAVSGNRVNSDIYNFDQWTLAYEDFDITNN